MGKKLNIGIKNKITQISYMQFGLHIKPWILKQQKKGNLFRNGKWQAKNQNQTNRATNNEEKNKYKKHILFNKTWHKYWKEKHKEWRNQINAMQS